MSTDQRPITDAFDACERCGRTLPEDPDGWSGRMEGGHIVGIVCPGCLTDEQRSEVELRGATADHQVVTDETGGLAVIASTLLEDGETPRVMRREDIPGWFGPEK